MVDDLLIFANYHTLQKLARKDSENRHHETRRGVVIQCKIYHFMWGGSYNVIANQTVLR